MEGIELIRTDSLISLRSFVLALTALLVATATSFADSNDRQVTKLADGVYAIQHENFAGAESGNTTVVIGDREVFVVDSCYFPSVAREDIAQIRQWTDKPVGYLLITHFHNDHNNGSKTYLDAFPSLAVVAQEETKKDMDLIQPGNIARGPGAYEGMLAAFKQGKSQSGRPLSEEEKKEVHELIPDLEKAKADFKTMVYQSPTLTFSEKLGIDLGNREVQVKHLGRGNTPGDAIAYLPKEKILVAGGSSKVPGLLEALRQEFSMPVEILNPFQKIAPPASGSGMDLIEGNAGQLAVAVGLALRSFEEL